MKEKIKVAVIGYGNVGKSAIQAIKEEPDMELVGIVEQKELTNCRTVEDIRCVKKITELEKVDVAIVSVPSRLVPAVVIETISAGINTVDSFDIHTEILDVQKKLDPICKANGKASIVAAGWDPGIDSIIRGLFLTMAPKGITHTNYGPGMSMGHTCAVKAIKGVKDALSITVPLGMGIHKRMVYVELNGEMSIEAVEKAVKNDPYFIKDETIVVEVKDIDRLINVSHGVMMERSGVSGITHNQVFKYECRINNPALTSQVMVSSARAVTRQKPGCYTMIDIPVIDFLSEEKDSLIRSLV
jgi:diaminopimelate dehydrogenase